METGTHIFPTPLYIPPSPGTFPSSFTCNAKMRRSFSLDVIWALTTASCFWEVIACFCFCFNGYVDVSKIKDRRILRGREANGEGEEGEATYLGLDLDEDFTESVV